MSEAATPFDGPIETGTNFALEPILMNPIDPPTPQQMFDWLQDRIQDGCVITLCKVAGGVHVSVDATGGKTVRAARGARTLTQGIMHLMAGELAA